jgi:hypothetical protein
MDETRPETVWRFGFDWTTCSAPGFHGAGDQSVTNYHHCSAIRHRYPFPGKAGPGAVAKAGRFPENYSP